MGVWCWGRCDALRLIWVSVSADVSGGIATMPIWVSRTVLAGRWDETGLERRLDMMGMASGEGGLERMQSPRARAAA